MLFYKVEGLMTEDYSGFDRMAFREMMRKIAVKADKYNRRNAHDSFYFISEVTDGMATAGIMTGCAEKGKSSMKAFLSYIGIDLNEVVITEITLNAFKSLLSAVSIQSFVDDDEEIMEKFGLDKLTGRNGCDIDFGENIIEECGRKELYDKAGKYLLSDTLLPELDRIYGGKAVSKFYGHPVHYMIQTDDRDTCGEVCRLLLQSLYENHRLVSRRYSFLDFWPGSDFCVTAYDMLYKVCAGGRRYRSVSCK